FENKEKTWQQIDIIYEIHLMTRLSPKTIQRVFKEYRQNNTLSDPKKYERAKTFTPNSNDKQIIESVFKKFFSEDRIPYMNDIYNELKSNSELNVSFKKCSYKTFSKLYKEMGFKVINSPKVGNQVLKHKSIECMRIIKRVKKEKT